MFKTDTQQFILDGEIVYVDAENPTGPYLEFNEIDRRRQENVSDLIVESDEVVKLPKVLVFDILALNDTDLSQSTLKYRKKIIAKVLNLKALVNTPVGAKADDD